MSEVDIKPMHGASQAKLKKFWKSLPKTQQTTVRFEDKDLKKPQEFYSAQFPNVRTVVMPRLPDAKRIERSTGDILTGRNDLPVTPEFKEGYVQCSATTKRGERCRRMVVTHDTGRCYAHEK